MPVRPPPAVIVAFICSLRIGGAERLLVDWLIAMKKTASVRTVLIILNHDYDESLLAALTENNIEILMLGRRRGGRSPGPLARLMRALWELSPDIVHVHDYATQRIALLIKLLLPKIRIFATVHNTRDVELYAPWYRRAANMLGFHFIAISNAVAADCRAYDLRKLTVVENGVQLAPYRAIRRLRGILPDIRIICVARLFPPQKGQDVLLDALEQCRASGMHVSCRFLGGDSSLYADARQDLEKRAAGQGLANSVEFFLDVTDVAAALDQANLFVLPSRYEGFGIAIVEAMAAGLPVIASNVDGIREIIEDGVNGFLVPPDDSTALFTRICEVSRWPDLPPIVSAAASRAEDFSIEKMCDRHMRAYSQ